MSYREGSNLGLLRTSEPILFDLRVRPLPYSICEDDCDYEEIEELATLPDKYQETIREVVTTSPKYCGSNEDHICVVPKTKCNIKLGAPFVRFGDDNATLVGMAIQDDNCNHNRLAISRVSQHSGWIEDQVRSWSG